MIRLADLSFTYNATDKPALRNIDLTIDDGEFVLISGASGSGKSTLCRCLNGLVPHFYGGKISGKAEVQGMGVMKHTTRDLATRVGMVFQDPENQLVTSDVEREIAFGMENLGFGRDLIARRIEESLDTVGIAALRFRRLDELSGGEKQKVAVASVLALHPEVLVLDEPTSELDPKGAEEVLSLLQRLNDELGISVILSEHRLDRVVHLVDRVIIMDDGKITISGHPRQVMGDPHLETTGVGVPPVIRLMQRLNNHGLGGNELPLTVKDARLKIGSIIREVKPASFSRNRNKKTTPVIDIEKLWFVYPGSTTALKDISLTVGAGEFVAVMGRNASGKSTLVKHLNGLLTPTKGRVIIDGVDSKNRSVAELSRKVGYVFQSPNDHLFAETVEDEIALALRNRGLNPSAITEAVERMLDRFDLVRYRHSYPRFLSGGEKQRIALASVLVAQPGIVVLDEPTRGMDYRLKKELMTSLDDYRKSGNTVIVVTHDVETVAEFVDRVLLLSEGRIVVDGDKRDVLSRALLFSPQINRLAQALVKYGVSDATLTVDEMVRQIL
ncbi:ABC transporter ATP-binding protein [Chloroflexota bacterium]